MEIEMSVLRRRMKENCLYLGEPRVVIKFQTGKNNERTSSTPGAPSMAVCAHSLWMEVVVQTWPQLLWWRSSNSRPKLTHIHTQFNGSIKVKVSKSLLVV